MMLASLADWITQITEWFDRNSTVVTVIVIVSIVMFVGALVTMPLLVIHVPQDFFLRHDRPSVRQQHTPLRLTLIVLRNVIGWALLLAGIAMLVLPGQGLLTILVGVVLTDFPGKRRIEHRIVRQPTIHRMIDWIRRKAGRPPILLPEHDGTERSTDAGTPS